MEKLHPVVRADIAPTQWTDWKRVYYLEGSILFNPDKKLKLFKWQKQWTKTNSNRMPE